MNKGLRWRIITLQVVMVVVLGFCAGFLYWGNSFVTGMVHDQLAAQKIYFPTSDSAAIKALPPADAAAMQQYAGQQMTTGDQAKVYANNFIGVHLQEVAKGQTYAQVSAASLADPKNTTLQNQANTLFKGETLRGLLLNAYGWSQVGLYAFYAAIGLTVASIVVLGTLIFEAVTALRTAPAPKLIPQTAR